MSERKSIFWLITIMITACLVVAGATILILYKTAIKEQRLRLMETAQSQARLIEAIARFDAIYSKNYPGKPITATLSQIIDAHDHDAVVGKTEFTLSKKEGENIVFLLRHRYDDHSKPVPVPFESELAEPMRRALLGQSGTIVGMDYRGEKVLAAYEPVAELNLGIVAKIDMFEVRAPFMKSALIGVLFTVLVVSIGAGFFIRITNPMIRQLEKRSLELKKMNAEMEVEINERKKAEAALWKSERELNIRNRISEIFLTIPDNDMYGEVLNVVLEVMKSKYGTFAYIDEDGTRIVPSMTRGIWDECKMAEKDIVFPRETWGDNIWARCLIEKKPISSNGPFKVPNGHIPITRSLALPIIHQGEVIGNFMVGNKPTDYDEKDRKLLETIAESMAPILKTRLQRNIQKRKRKQAEEDLQKAHDTLEHRVKERTAEIEKVNERLGVEIEERGQAERAVRESEERYALAIAGSTDGIWDWDILSDTVFYSERFREFLGYSSEEFSSTLEAFRSCLHPDEADAVMTAVKQHLQERVPYNIKYRLQTKWGEYRWFHARGQAIWDSKGNATRMSGSIQDITDHKKQEEEFRKTKKLLQSVFDGIPDPLVLMDERLKVRIINRAAIRYYQIEKPEDISGKCCYEALLGKSAPCEGCQVPAAVASRKSGSFERKGVMNPNNLEQVDIYHFDEKGHNFGGALMRIHDITESRLMERKMIHNEKLASLGFAISCITHEIANPISAITFNAPILKDYINAMIPIVDDYAKGLQDFELFQMPYPQFRKDAFKITANILHASQRINTTVSDLRKLYGQKKQQEKRWVDLKHLVERINAVTGIEIHQYVKSLEINIPENLPKIYTDPDAVEQILTNLLINAAHAADKQDSRVKLDVMQGDTWKDHFIIELSDNGCGMDQKTMSKIFNPFFTTKAPGQGTGLGLYVCQDLVKDLGGRIEVQSEPGNGSVFRVVLPDIERRLARRL